MESTLPQDNRDIILDVTLFAENLAEVSYWKAKVFAFLLSTSMAVLALKTTFRKTIIKNYTSMKFIILCAWYYLDSYLQTTYMFFNMVLKFKWCVKYPWMLISLLVMFQICWDQLGQHNQTGSKNQKYMIYSKRYHEYYEVSKMPKLKLAVEEIWNKQTLNLKSKRRKQLHSKRNFNILLQMFSNQYQKKTSRYIRFQISATFSILTSRPKIWMTK